MFASVIVCTHNRCRSLLDTLTALNALRAPDRGEWELIIVDNASTDGTLEVVEKFKEAAQIAIRYVYEPQLGHARALNSGIAAASGEIVAFTDDDAIPQADWLRSIERSFARHNADWVFGRVHPIWPAEAAPHWFGPTTRPIFAVLDYGSVPFRVSDSSHTFYGVNHACRREAVQSLGCYNPELGATGSKTSGSNDEDLCRRALLAGLNVWYDPSIVVGHVISPARCRKATHRRSTWREGQGYYDYIWSQHRNVPWLFGAPRFFYMLLAKRAVSLCKAWLRCDPADSFCHELAMLRMLRVIQLGLVRSITCPTRRPSDENAAQISMPSDGPR